MIYFTDNEQKEFNKLFEKYNNEQFLNQKKLNEFFDNKLKECLNKSDYKIFKENYNIKTIIKDKGFEELNNKLYLVLRLIKNNNEQIIENELCIEENNLFIAKEIYVSNYSTDKDFIERNYNVIYYNRNDEIFKYMNILLTNLMQIENVDLFIQNNLSFSNYVDCVKYYEGIKLKREEEKRDKIKYIKNNYCKIGFEITLPAGNYYNKKNDQTFALIKQTTNSFYFKTNYLDNENKCYNCLIINKDKYINEILIHLQAIERARIEEINWPYIFNCFGRYKYIDDIK